MTLAPDFEFDVVGGCGDSPDCLKARRERRWWSHLIAALHDESVGVVDARQLHDDDCLAGTGNGVRNFIDDEVGDRTRGMTDDGAHGSRPVLKEIGAARIPARRASSLKRRNPHECGLPSRRGTSGVLDHRSCCLVTAGRSDLVVRRKWHGHRPSGICVEPRGGSPGHPPLLSTAHGLSLRAREEMSLPTHCALVEPQAPYANASSRLSKNRRSTAFVASSKARE